MGRSFAFVFRVALLCDALRWGAWLLRGLSGKLRVLWAGGYAGLLACSPKAVAVLYAGAASAVGTVTRTASVSLQVPFGHCGRPGEDTRAFYSLRCCPCHSSWVGTLLYLRWRLLR